MFPLGADFPVETKSTTSTRLSSVEFENGSRQLCIHGSIALYFPKLRTADLMIRSISLTDMPVDHDSVHCKPGHNSVSHSCCSFRFDGVSLCHVGYRH
jgi:hypothetical protein